MKLAYVINIFPKLSESFILNEIVELLKNGHDVLIFSIIKPWEEVVHDDVDKYQILERTHYFSFKNIFKINIIHFSKYLIYVIIQDLLDFKTFNQKASKPKAIQKKKSILTLIQKIKSQIYEIRRFYIVSIHRFILYLKLAFFATIIEKNDVELIHTHFATMGSIAGRLSKMLRLPYTLTAHAFDIYQNPDVAELHKVIEGAKSVITISEYNKNYLNDEIDIKNRIDVIRCGIDLDKFNSKIKLKTGDRIKMLTVARLVEKKGIEYLIKAIPMVIKEMPDSELIIVGSGPLNDYIHKLVHDLGVGDYVQFRGDASDSELMRCYEDADMFILPCIIVENGDRDGIPVVMMEAMAMGLPVVSTDVSGIPELVESGVSGMLVPPKDEKAIADAIIKICKDGELRVGMGKEGRKIIERKFDITFEAEKLLGVFINVTK